MGPDATSLKGSLFLSDVVDELHLPQGFFVFYVALDQVIAIYEVILDSWVYSLIYGAPRWVI